MKTEETETETEGGMKERRRGEKKREEVKNPVTIQKQSLI